MTPIYRICSEETTATFLKELRYTHSVFHSPVVYQTALKGIMMIRPLVTALNDDKDTSRILDAFAKRQC